MPPNPPLPRGRGGLGVRREQLAQSGNPRIFVPGSREKLAVPVNREAGKFGQRVNGTRRGVHGKPTHGGVF